MKHLLTIPDLTETEVHQLIQKALDIKKHPKKYQRAAYEKVLLTFFAAPSLRTELSFDTAMFKMGGEIIDYHSETSPWAKGKETITDVAKVMSRYCDIVMIRMYDHKAIEQFAKNSTIPVINGMSDYSHPCQVLSDLLTITEKFGKFKGLKLAYVGDSHNNVTHSLLFGCSMMGIDITVACPKTHAPLASVLRKAKKLARKSKVEVTQDAVQAVTNCDIIYTDSWMSYNIPHSQLRKRIKIFKPYEVTTSLLHHAKSNAVFMHCLPATRGLEVTAPVIDGKQSIVFDQAENRLHMQKAIILKLLKSK